MLDLVLLFPALLALGFFLAGLAYLDYAELQVFLLAHEALHPSIGEQDGPIHYQFCCLAPYHQEHHFPILRVSLHAEDHSLDEGTMAGSKLHYLELAYFL